MDNESSKVVAMVRQMAFLKQNIDSLAEEQSGLQRQYDAIRLKDLPDLMQDEGYKNLSVTGVGRVALRVDVYASIPASSKDEAYAWLIANGHEGMVAPYVQPGTLKAWCRGMLRDGVELPPELFKVVPFTMATITKE